MNLELAVKRQPQLGYASSRLTINVTSYSISTLSRYICSLLVERQVNCNYVAILAESCKKLHLFCESCKKLHLFRESCKKVAFIREIPKSCANAQKLQKVALTIKSCKKVAIITLYRGTLHQPNFVFTRFSSRATCKKKLRLCKIIALVITYINSNTKLVQFSWQFFQVSKK